MESELLLNVYQRIIPIDGIKWMCIFLKQKLALLIINTQNKLQQPRIMNAQACQPTKLAEESPHDRFVAPESKIGSPGSQEAAEVRKSGMIQTGEEENLDQEKKKNESKQKYRRYKQKLANMCYEHQEKCVVKESKEVSSPNKSRLLTIAIELEKMALNQTKDYYGLETKLEAISKILDHKREHDLIILKHSRFVPAFCGLLKKVPAFHKNEFNQSRRTLELGIKILRIFCTLSSNRDYMISTNQLTILNSCLSSFCSKEERKLALECLSILHGLLSSKIRPDSEQIVQITIQIVFFSQLGRKIRLGLESYLAEDSCIEEDYVLKSLQYFHTLYRKYFDRLLEKPVYEQVELQQFMQQNSDALICFLETFLPMFLLDREGELKEEELPICMINICLYALKLLNINTHVNLKSAQKILEILPSSQFVQAIRKLFVYSKKSVEEGSHNHELLAVCSEIMTFLGKISFKNDEIKASLRTSGLLDCLYDHPLKYLMDNKLKCILFPALCSTMDSNEQNIKKFLLESSAENLISYITAQKKTSKEMQVHKLSEGQTQSPDPPQEDIDKCSAMQPSPCVVVSPPAGSQNTLTRKSSVSSVGSYTTVCTQNSYSLFQPQQEQKEYQKLLNVLPLEDWSSLIEDLSRLDI